MIVPVKTDTWNYDIVLEPGAIKKAGELLNLNRRVLVVTDSGVPAQYAETVAAQCSEAVIVTIPQGEQSKCFDEFRHLLSEMLDKSFTRGDCVVAVGGGVVGDLSGFAASCYMRGVDFYNIPTTLLSQVDSSIGGKTAIDFGGVKNIVGAFYQPKKVIIDPEVLETLSRRQLMAGLAEAIKMAATNDKELFELFEKGNIKENIDTIIEKSLKIKRAVVEQDEKEEDLRKILNFGHTLAHAIESENEMQNLYHGECVALGMIPMCSEEVKNRLIPVLERLNLPTSTAVTADTIINAMRHDKKMSDDKITVIFVNTVGEYEMKEMPFDMFAEKIRGSLG